MFHALSHRRSTTERDFPAAGWVAGGPQGRFRSGCQGTRDWCRLRSIRTEDRRRTSEYGWAGNTGLVFKLQDDLETDIKTCRRAERYDWTSVSFQLSTLFPINWHHFEHGWRFSRHCLINAVLQSTTYTLGRCWLGRRRPEGSTQDRTPRNSDWGSLGQLDWGRLHLFQNQHWN